MSNCLCLACDRANSITTKFCTQCGARLQIQERYRALKVIGQGGFGKTFLAQDEGKPSKPRCVIKQFLYDDPASLREAQRLFEQEAVRLDDLGKHSQIPELLAHCEQDGRQYLVQEFIDGGNLLQELNRLGRFDQAKIKALLLDLLPVLQFIHVGQVIHRDIKPENIIRRRSDSKLVLVDFGAAKMATKTALAKTGTAIGSAEYVSPEQAFGKAIFASDIYSLGVSCLHLLTGVYPLTMYDPIEGFAWQDFLQNQQREEKLCKVLDKMTDINARHRYQSVQAILEDFKVNHHLHPISPSSLLSSISTGEPLLIDCGKDVKIELVYLKSGDFMMGGYEVSRNNPFHQVRLNGFFIGKYPITQVQYETVMGGNPSFFRFEQHPVERISWVKAIEFCKKLSQKTGHKINLPSEAEWEYAARAGCSDTYNTYVGKGGIEQVGWSYTTSGDRTHPVGQKECNEIGIYDMSGNVSEWCLDVWHESYDLAPTDGNPWLIGGDQNERVIRGGSFEDRAIQCRAESRDSFPFKDSHRSIGFRIVVTQKSIS